ncbi:hypothetical protein D3C81_1016470 [compost metagenome]
MAVPIEPLAITCRGRERGALVGLVIHPQVDLAPCPLNIRLKRHVARLGTELGFRLPFEFMPDARANPAVGAACGLVRSFGFPVPGNAHAQTPDQ